MLILALLLLRHTRTTDSLPAAKSAEFLLRLAPPEAACALLRHTRTTDSLRRYETVCFSIVSRRAFAACALLLISSTGLLAQDVFTGVERIVAVGDVHGDYSALVEILRSAGIVDAKNKWAAGKTHLVQTGDLLDRGAESRKVMDLIISLEKQASKAGGRVHSLLGNHEAMNVYGDLRYAVPGEFAAFKTGDSAAIRDAFWQEQAPKIFPKPDQAARKVWDDEHPLGWLEHRYAFGPQGEYGRWIRSKKAVIRIDDTLFLHGGIGPKYATTPIAELNREIIERLKDLSKIKDGDIVTSDDGPLWYRGLAQSADSEDHLKQVLEANGVKRIVIGHTPTSGTIEKRYDGRVIVVDIGMAAAFGSRGRACLVIEQGNISVINRGRRQPL